MNLDDLLEARALRISTGVMDAVNRVPSSVSAEAERSLSSHVEKSRGLAAVPMDMPSSCLSVWRQGLLLFPSFRWWWGWADVINPVPTRR